MNWFIITIMIIVVSMPLLTTNSTHAQKIEKDSILEGIFKSIDTNGDGTISKEEWHAVDTDRNGNITQKEWERYRYKSSPKESSKWFDIKWFDYNGDGFMDADEFFNHNQRYKRY